MIRNVEDAKTERAVVAREGRFLAGLRWRLQQLQKQLASEEQELLGLLAPPLELTEVPLQYLPIVNGSRSLKTCGEAEEDDEDPQAAPLDGRRPAPPSPRTPPLRPYLPLDPIAGGGQKCCFDLSRLESEDLEPLDDLPLPSPKGAAQMSTESLAWAVGMPGHGVRDLLGTNAEDRSELLRTKSEDRGAMQPAPHLRGDVDSDADEDPKMASRTCSEDLLVDKVLGATGGAMGISQELAILHGCKRKLSKESPVCEDCLSKLPRLLDPLPQQVLNGVAIKEVDSPKFQNALVAKRPSEEAGLSFAERCRVKRSGSPLD